MLISFNWIKEFVPISLTAEVFAEQLTMLGLEVAEVRKVNQPLTGLVIGEVVTKAKHPNADKLALTTIRYDVAGKTETVPVICGAPNIAVGQKIAYATIGTTLPNGMRIKKARIRGVESYGMVCSLQELGKEEISETIWTLPQAARLTEPITLYMGEEDVIFDIEVTSNRSDAMSIIGVAREAAALLETEVTFPDHLAKLNAVFEGAKAGKTTDKIQVAKSLKTLDIEITDFEDTPRYMALAVSGVQVKPSPRWLCDRLHHHGQRPINNIVDITNLIMLEYGQPLHAFDGGTLHGKSIDGGGVRRGGIVVRRAKSGERLITLDERKVSLTESDLIIADKEQPIGLAGVMGGKGSGITEQTQEVIIEAAYFSATAVGRTAARTGFDTEAAKRFIRGTVDRELTPHALCKAALLMVELGGGTLTSEIFDGLKTIPVPPTITLHSSRIKKDLNLTLTEAEVANFLKRIGCAVTSALADTGVSKTSKVATNGKDYEFSVIPPLFRKDLKHEWDLIEEIARLYGYDRIPVTFPQATHGEHGMLDPITEMAHSVACALGYSEVVTYPFVEEAYFAASGEVLENLLTPRNPVVSSASVLRTTMLPGALKTLRANFEKRNTLQGSFFESGHVFNKMTADTPGASKGLIQTKAPASKEPAKVINAFQANERRVMGFLRFVPVREPRWYDKEAGVDFYTLSGDLESFLSYLFPRRLIGKQVISEAEAKRFSFLRQSERALLVVDGKQVGYLGRVSDAVLRYFDFQTSKPIYYGELALEPLISLKRAEARSFAYRPASPYPFLTRDVALVVAEEVVLGDFLKAIEKTHECVERVALLEVYRGKELSAARPVDGAKAATLAIESSDVVLKSFVFRLQLRSREKTLLSAEADRIVGHVIKKLARQYTFKLR